MIDKGLGFTLTRVLPVTPEQVWRAWLDPECIAQWWHPEGAHTPPDSVRVDARVGGSYRYAMVNNESGDTVTTGGVYLELEPFSRLVFTWGEPDADPDDTPVVTLTLEPVPEGTRLTFDLRGVDGFPGDGFFHGGWVSTLATLEQFLT